MVDSNGRIAMRLDPQVYGEPISAKKLTTAMDAVGPAISLTGRPSSTRASTRY